jgi:hypothetical protein
MYIKSCSSKRHPQSKWATIAKERVELIRNNCTYLEALNNYIVAEKYFEQGKI